MHIAYFDAASGIAGDMTLAALVDAGADRDYITRQIDSLGLPGVKLDFSETTKHSFRCLRLDVRHSPEHAHRHLSDIKGLIDASRLTADERLLAVRIFERLAAAEAKVHGTSLDSVHFHEVGAVDSIVDIVGSAIALRCLGIERIIASPIPTGSGQIKIAHGLVSIPAPATAELLKAIPIRSTTIEAELTTPTGAAILAALADGFGPLPDMQIAAIGYGAGHRDLHEQANLLRVLVGESLIETSDEIVLLETNVDDMTGEQIGYALEKLRASGALDVYTSSIQMKKSRPGTTIAVVGRPEGRDRLERCLFQHTASLGIRRTYMTRQKLRRWTTRVESRWGPIQVKVAEGCGINRRYAPEYEDCRRIAEQHELRLDDVYQSALDAASASLTATEALEAKTDDAQPLDAGRESKLDRRVASDHDHMPHDHHH